MTRAEQILNNAIDYSEHENNFIEYDDCGDVCDDKSFIEKAFINGAEWADRTMLNKACEWLAKHISPEEIYEYEADETPTTYLTVNIHDTMLDFINDFRKAMKGGAE